MYAVSLVGTVARVDAGARELLERRSFAEGTPTATFRDAQLMLCEVAELLDSHRPFRLERHEDRVGAAVRHVVEAVYERGQVRQTAVDSEAVSVARQGAGLVERDGWLFLPLGRAEPICRNWRSVFEVLSDRLEGISDRYGQLARRLRNSEGAASHRRACDTVREMLDVLRSSLERLTTVRDYVSIRTDHDQTELLETAKRQMTAFSGDTDA
ncbi:hypothetical protein [Haloarcula sediminis]|uniref:hypothetical protein n=1 Tax=Haloarcula sediminis TaxID=3111777 RepID=UPI002D7A2B69|nr:hypothetical protein [Haloarcula sp. CK38]